MQRSCRASISASRYGMQQQHATTTTTSDWIGPAQHNTAISVTCARVPISSTNLALTDMTLHSMIEIYIIISALNACIFITYLYAYALYVYARLLGGLRSQN